MSDTYKENENAGADEIYDTSAAKCPQDQPDAQRMMTKSTGQMG